MKTTSQYTVRSRTKWLNECSERVTSGASDDELEAGKYILPDF
jgi:hypothetical protein